MPTTELSTGNDFFNHGKNHALLELPLPREKSGPELSGSASAVGSRDEL